MREAVGWDIPVVAGSTSTPNLEPDDQAADILIGYDTYPHIDMAARG